MDTTSDFARDPREKIITNVQALNSPRDLAYCPNRKSIPSYFPVTDSKDTRNFSKFVTQEPFDRSMHLNLDMANKLSPFVTRKASHQPNTNTIKKYFAWRIQNFIEVFI